MDNSYKIYASQDWVAENTKKLIAAPTNVTTGSLLMFNGTDWVGITKDELITEIIAAIPSAEGGSF
jgi:hypothetical protein